jgi:hypothetical protein
VADKEPYNKKDAEDPRNRRISVILLNLGEPGKKPTAEGVAALRADNLTQSRALEAFDLAAKTRVGSRIAAKPADGHAAKPAPAQH